MGVHGILQRTKELVCANDGRPQLILSSAAEKKEEDRIARFAESACTMRARNAAAGGRTVRGLVCCYHAAATGRLH